MNQTTSNSQLNTAFFGHPKGLQTLFLTEMWERMSYYGMRGLLVIFMTAAITDGGMAMTTATATAIYGIYTASVYFMGLPGGWLADRLIGGQKAIWYGGIIIMLGHIVLAIPNQGTFFIGLILVVLGTGLLKPNIGAVVGLLYRSDDDRRDSGYAIYYMGINIGSLIGYTVCGYLGEEVGWHYGFGAAAVGMALGLIHFQLTKGNLQGAAEHPTQSLSAKGASFTYIGIVAFLIIIAGIAFATLTGNLTLNAEQLRDAAQKAFMLIFFLSFAYIFFLGKLSSIEKKGLGALFLVCVASTCFWLGFEQAGSSLSLFTRDFTEKTIFGFDIPITWFQNANPFFIIMLTPFFAAFWIRLGQRWVTPGYGIKCAIGLMIMGSGFIVMVVAAQIAASGTNAAAYFLILTYFLHTVGELWLSPIALSAVSKLAPKRYIGQMMGVFVLTYSMGNIIASQLAAGYDAENVADLPNLYMQIATISIGVGAVVLLIGMFTKGWEKQIVDDKAASDKG